MDYNHRDHAHVMKFHELCIDHKLVNAESQQNVDFRTRKAIKQRKNTYGGSPNANLDQRNSGMKQNFNLELLDLILVIFYTKGGGVFIGKVEPLGSFIEYRVAISCVHLSKCCGKSENAPWLLIG